MYIDEVPNGSPVTLQILHNNKKLELVSIIRTHVQSDTSDIHCCYVEPFTHDNKILKFDTGTLFALCDNITDDKQYKYRLNLIRLVKISNVTYHQLVSNDNVKFINRREAIRVPISVAATITSPSGNIIGKTKDISASGIAIVVDSDNKLQVGDRVRCKFEKFYTSYSVACRIVRIVKDKQSNRFLLGCEFERNYQDINSLVNDIQMQHRKSKGVNK